MQATLIILPVAAYVLLALAFVLRSDGKNLSSAIVKAHLIVFAFIAVSTEALSAFQAISFSAILAAWILFLLACCTIALRMHKNHRGFVLPAWRRTTPLAMILVGAVGFVLAATFATGVLYPPNTWDSMTYHMPRVAHWIGNGSVAFYPTAIVRQNYLAPLAEFAIMRLQVLTDCDLYANLVQWTSFLALVCLGVVVAAELGLSRWQQLVSAVVVAVIPMAILQAWSTQNDLVVASFVMSFGYFMLCIRKAFSLENLLFAAIGLGLAILTKGTAYLYGAAIGTSLALPIVMSSRHTRAGLIRALAGLSMIVAVAVLLNSGHLWRNYQLYGHPLSTGTDVIHNEDMSVPAVLSNIVRNGALHMGTPSSRVRRQLNQTVQAILGSRLNDPKTTWAGASFEIPYTRHEDAAGNLIHMLVIAFSAVSIPILWARRQHLQVAWYAVGVVMAGVLFCWMLKWQPWASRLHTPLFAMAAPLMAITMTSSAGMAGKHVGRLMVLLMILYSIRFVVANNSRDLESLRWSHRGRNELYFESRKLLFPGYHDAVKIVRESGVQTVGLYCSGDSYEYPFWALAQQTGKGEAPIAFKHVGVENRSAALGEEEFLPAYVIATKNIERWEHAAEYVPIYESDYVDVFRASGQD